MNKLLGSGSALSRRIGKLPDHVYFVIGGPFMRYDGTGEYTTVDGPYSSLSAAKGKRTSMAGANYGDRNKAQERLSKYTIVESPAGEWKKVDLD